MENNYSHKFSNDKEAFWVQDLEQESLNIYSDTGVDFLRIGKDQFATIKRVDLLNFLKRELRDFTEQI